MDKPKPTMKQAILAQCHMCMGRYSDGKQDCENVTCSLYKWMPYAKLEANTDWEEYHPKRAGLVKYEDIDTSNRSAEHLKKYHREKND
jgi:hypothetical protein